MLKNIRAKSVSLLFGIAVLFLFLSQFAATSFAAPSCSFSVYANGSGPYSLNGFKFWAGLPSTYYEVSISVSDAPGNYAVYLVKPTGDTILFLSNQSSSTIKEYFAADSSLFSGGGYKFRVTPQGVPGTTWGESDSFYQGVLPNLTVTTSPTPMVIGEQATVNWTVSGGLSGLANGGWTGDIRLQWYQNSTPLSNLDQISVSDSSYSFTVPDSITGGTVPGVNFRIAGVNADIGTSIPGGMVSDFSGYFDINSPPKPNIGINQSLVIAPTRTNPSTIYSLPELSEYGGTAPFESEKNLKASFRIVNNGDSSVTIEDWGVLVTGGVSTDFQITSGSGFNLSSGSVSGLFDKRGYITDDQLAGGSTTTFTGQVQVKIDGTWIDATGSGSSTTFTVYPRPSLTNGMLIKKPRNEFSSDPNDAKIYFYQNDIKWDGAGTAYDGLFPAWETEYYVYPSTTIAGLAVPSIPNTNSIIPIITGRNLLYKLEGNADVYIIEPEPGDSSIVSRKFENEEAFYSYGYSNTILNNEPVEIEADQISWIQSQYPVGTTITSGTNAPYFDPAPTLSSTVVIPESINFLTGVAIDYNCIASIRMDVTRPDGQTVEAFTDNELNGQTSKDLTVYWFGSNEVYSGVVGSYTVKLTVTGISGQSISRTFPVNVESIQTCGTLEVNALSDSEIYTPLLDNYQYRYGLSIILNGNTVDMWAAAPDTTPVTPVGEEAEPGEIPEDRWDHIVHCRGTINADRTIDECKTEEDWTSVLVGTPGSRDRYSACDPGVFSFDGYYYIGYTSTDQKVGDGAISNDVFVARFNDLPDGSPDVICEKWNGNGWGGDPWPFIEYNGDTWGKGQPSFVVKDNLLYIYYTDNGTKVVTVDATDQNWPALVDETKAVTIFTNDSATYEFGGKPGPFEVKFIDDLQLFIGTVIVNEFNPESNIVVFESKDGLHFTAVATSKNNWISITIQDRAHNIGISGDEEGHLDRNSLNFIAYGYGIQKPGLDDEGFKARWPTYLNRIDVGLTEENCQPVEINLEDLNNLFSFAWDLFDRESIYSIIQNCINDPEYTYTIWDLLPTQVIKPQTNAWIRGNHSTTNNPIGLIESNTPNGLVVQKLITPWLDSVWGNNISADDSFNTVYEGAPSEGEALEVISHIDQFSPFDGTTNDKCYFFTYDTKNDANGDAVTLSEWIDYIKAVTVSYGRPIDTLTIFAHGSTASVNMSDGFKLEDNLATRQSIERLKNENILATDATILLFSCDVGKGSAGEAFIQNLADWSGATVYASSNLTGPYVKKDNLIARDWDLDVVKLPTDPGTSQAPLAVAESPNSVLINTPVTLDGTKSIDTDDGIASYFWEQLSGTTGYLSDVNSIQPVFTAPALSQDEVLIFQLTVTDHSGLQSTDTSAITLTTGNTLPSPPTGVSVCYQSSIEWNYLTWNHVSDAVKYKVYWSTSPGVTVASNVMPETVTTDYGHTGVVSGSCYYYRVSAVNSAGGESGLSSEAFVCLPAALPDSPTGISAIYQESSDRNYITWNQSNNATGYKVYWGTSHGVTTTSNVMPETATIDYGHTGVENGSCYYYRVSAINSVGESALSAEASVCLPAEPPNIPHVIIENNIQPGSPSEININGSKEINCRLTISNTGDAAALVNIGLDMAGDDLEMVSSTVSFSTDKSFNQIAVSAGGSVDIDYTARYVGSDTTHGHQVVNTARIMWIDNYYDESASVDLGGHGVLTSQVVATIIVDNPDTDEDGLTDWEEENIYATDPHNSDTDSDGIQDGTELGYTLNDIGSDTDTNIFRPDLDPTSITDPLYEDTDGDGILDGAEDANRNGMVDTNFDVPGYEGKTRPVGINSSGQIVAMVYVPSSFNGFLLDGDSVTQISYPDSLTTEVVGINNIGQVVGYYTENDAVTTHGFIFDDGTYTNFDVPGYEGKTRPVGINSSGQIVAMVSAPCYSIGFLLDGDSVTQISYPGSLTTGVVGINDIGQVVGYYTENDAITTHGFIFQDGTYATETDPCNADTDSDQMPDGWEVENGLNPNLDDAGDDPDGDWFTNGREFQDDTDPNDGSSHLILLEISGRIPDSGQTTSYTDAFGEDSDYTINPPSYIKMDAEGNYLSDSATEWAMDRDNVTGLIWEVKTDDGSIHDKDNKYTWYDSNPETNGGDAGTPGDGTDTEDFINSLNSQNFGGYSDWRMPTSEELRSIVDYGRCYPATETKYFPNTLSSNYWSCTTNAYSTAYAWSIDFYYGYANHYGNKSNSYYVRAVRGGQSRSFGNLVINGDGTVTDTATGLIWQQGTAETMNWEEAITYCENLSLGGYSDWRLPTIKELSSIADLGKYGPAIDTTAFPDALSSYYWSSTTSADNTLYAWRIDFSSGYGYSLNKSNSYYVRAVRGGQSWLFGHLIILAPAQSSCWEVGTLMPITWDAQGIAGNVKISISREGGKTGTFETIADSAPNDGNYQWTVTGSVSVNCVLKIEPADDPSKGTTQGLFAIISDNYPYVTISHSIQPGESNQIDIQGNKEVKYRITIANTGSAAALLNVGLDMAGGDLEMAAVPGGITYDSNNHSFNQIFVDTALAAFVCPTALFTYSESSGLLPEIVEFTGQSIGEIDSYFWDFGDGLTSTEQNPRHTYENAGLYTIRLTVAGLAGSSTFTDKIRLADCSNEGAQVDADQDGLSDYEECVLGTSSHSVDTDDDGLFDREEVKVYKTDPLNPDTDGDNMLDGPEVKEGCNPKGSGRLYEITGSGALSNCPMFITASFFAENAMGSTGVQFTNTSTGDIDECQWNFGDGKTSTEQNPSHTYSATGSYSVSLTVTGSAGEDTETKTEYVTTVPSRGSVNIDYTAQYVSSNTTDGHQATNTARIMWIDNYYDESTSVDLGGHGALTSGVVATVNNPSSEVTTTPNPSGNTFINSISVTLTSNEFATIYYTTDGSTPDTSSAQYTNPIQITDTTTLKYFAKDTAGNSENIKSETYIIDTAPTAISGIPAGKSTATDFVVTISGNGVVAYKYKLNDDSWSEEKGIGSTIPLNGLSASAHTLYVIGKDSIGNWQEEANANAVTWEIIEIAPGDINGDGYVDMDDAILSLQVVSNMELSSKVCKKADINGDGRIGIQEAIYVLQIVSGIRDQSDRQIDVVRSTLSRALSPNVEQTELSELVSGNNTFALELYQAIREENHNLFYSPYSISLALAMTYAGARNETEEQMADTLHFSLGQECLHPAFNALDLELASRGEGAQGQDGEGFRLNIANSIWGLQGYSFLPRFLDVLAENYGAGLRLLDFCNATEDSRIVINDWVSDETEGKIENLIPQGAISPLTRLVLTNAIYFNAAWNLPFDEELTTDGPFYLPGGSQIATPMMSQTGHFGYTEGENYQAVELMYDGEELSMVILHPSAGRFGEFESSFAPDLLNGILYNLELKNVQLKLPKFTYESSSVSLKETLAQLGMPIAFTDFADFSGMDGTRNLFISDVIHKAFILVDEAGTEAAAATAVIMSEMTSITPPPVEVTINRPFIFLIRDIKTGVILFAGRVLNPTS